MSLAIGIIGCGEVAEVHARCLRETGGTRIAAVCDVEEERAKAFGARWGAERVTRDARKVFSDPAVQAVYICTHHDSHLPLALQACEAGKAIFMEKPLALSMKECEEICIAVERAGVPFMMGFKMRFYPMVGRATQFMPSPRMVAAQMMDTRWPDAFWANDPRRGGGNVFSEGVHTFDLLSHLVNAKPVRVYAEAKNFHHASMPIVDGLVATIAFSNGAIASVTQGDLGHPPHVSKLSFQMFDGIRSVHLHDRLKAGTFFDGERTHVERDIDEFGYLEENRAFVDALRNGTRMPCEHIDGWRATMLIERAIDAARTGRVQDVSSL
jgi:predicted dehydrogenase